MTRSFPRAARRRASFGEPWDAEAPGSKSAATSARSSTRRATKDFTFRDSTSTQTSNAFTRSLGFTVHDGELTTFATDQTFDAVAIWNTFDQLADPRGSLHAASKLLRDGGILAVRVPNGAFYAAARRVLTEATA